MKSYSHSPLKDGAIIRPAKVMHFLHTVTETLFIKAVKRRLKADASVVSHFVAGIIITNLTDEISHELKVATGEVEGSEVLQFHR